MDWNGLSLLRWDDSGWAPNYVIQTDASGCASFWDNRWFQFRVGQIQHYGEGTSPNNFKLCSVGEAFIGKYVLFECDNSIIGSAVNKHYAREQNAMHLTLPLVFCGSF